MKRFFLLALLASAILPSLVQAGDISIKGHSFGDYAFIAAAPDSGLEGANGFQIRRINLTFTSDMGEGFDSRLRLEASQPALGQPSGSMTPFVKDAWLRFRADNGLSIILGLSATPLISGSQSFWGLRKIGKSFADLQNYGSTRDIGVALKGKFNDGQMGYHFMVGNGNSGRSENNEGKNIGLAVHANPGRGIFVEVAVQLDFKGDLEPGDWTTFRGTLGHRTEHGRAAIEFAQQTRAEAATDGDVEMRVGSAFALVHANEKVDAFVRFDQIFEAATATSNTHYLPIMSGFEHSVVIGGLDIALSESVSMSPNIQAVLYGDDADGNAGPENTVTGRLTFFLKF